MITMSPLSKTFLILVDKTNCLHVSDMHVSLHTNIQHIYDPSSIILANEHKHTLHTHMCTIHIDSNLLNLQEDLPLNVYNNGTRSNPTIAGVKEASNFCIYFRFIFLTRFYPYSFAYICPHNMYSLITENALYREYQLRKHIAEKVFSLYSCYSCITIIITITMNVIHRIVLSRA